MNMQGAGVNLSEHAMALAIRGSGFKGVVKFAEGVAEAMRQKVGIEGHGVPSKPGQYPRKQSGDLQDSIHVVEYPAEMIARVVIGVEYARYLEEGSAKMQPRPFIYRTFQAVARRGFRASVEG